MSGMLREFLRTEARKSEHRPYDPDKYWGEHPIEGYAEDVNEDALTNAWLDKSTSYIYKVGCLTLFDDNKRDFGWAFVGIERHRGNFQYLGSLYSRFAYFYWGFMNL